MFDFLCLPDVCLCFSGLETDHIDLSILLISTLEIVSIQSGIVIVAVKKFFSLNLSRSFHEKCLGDLNFSSYMVYEESCWIIQCFRIGFFLPFFRHHCFQAPNTIYFAKFAGLQIL